MMSKQPKNCIGCFRWKGNKCMGYATPYKENCPTKITNIARYLGELEDLLEFNKETNYSYYIKIKKEYMEVKREFEQDLRSVYKEETQRGSGGGKSESSARVAPIRDNRAPETKTTMKEKQEYKEALEVFEDEHGKLEKLGRGYGMSRTKIDSYTGEEIE